MFSLPLLPTSLMHLPSLLSPDSTIEALCPTHAPLPPDAYGSYGFPASCAGVVG